MSTFQRYTAVVVILGTVTFSAARPTHAATAIGVTSTNTLIRFDTATPGTIDASSPITGTAGGETIQAIDFRPISGRLYGFGSANGIYTIDIATGVATLGGTPSFATPISGASTGFDFNPAVDRLRVVNDANQDFRVNPNNFSAIDGDGGMGGVQLDTDLAFDAGDLNVGQNPNVVAAAYDRSFNGATLTTLLGIDSTLNILVRQGSINGTPISPNGGLLFTVGSLGFDPTDAIGFDILTEAGVDTAWATLSTNGTSSSLYTINLITGAATLVGGIGNVATLVRALAIIPVRATAIGVTSTNQLLRFDTSTPGTIEATLPITGLTSGETISAIDFRPLSGVLYALSSVNTVYTIDPTTGVATQVHPGIDFTPGFAAGSPAGFDFNPAVDRLRLVNAANDNARFNPVTNLPVDSDGNPANGNTPDADLAYIATDPNVGVDPSVVASAYDRNDNDAGTATTLFAIDSTVNNLVRQGAVDGNPADVAGGGSPNGGLLITLGSLGVDPTDVAAVDILTQSGSTNTAWAALQRQGQLFSELYRINLTGGLTNQPLGTATLVGSIGSGATLVPALAMIPELAGTGPFGTLQFSAPSYLVGEAGPVASITVDRVGGSNGIVTVRLSTSDGTASAPADYTDSDQTLIFPPSVTSQVAQIPVSGDMADEDDETINLTLSNATGGASLGAPVAAVLTINDDDPTVCGDGFANMATEACDDGNTVNTDDCPDGVGGTCQPATCGDGFVDMQGPATEECDDANMVEDDACTNACQDPTLDTDADGITTGVESSAPNGGDGNDDGTLDSMQGNVASLPNAVDGSYLAIVTDPSCPLEDVDTLLIDTQGFTLPFGALAFELPDCPTTKVTVFYHNTDTLLAPPFQYVKRGPNPPGAANDVVYTLSEGAPHNVMFGSADLDFDDAVGMVMFTLTESVVGDDTLGDSRIVDQGGPGLPTAVPAPALSYLGMLGALLTLIAVARRLLCE